MNNHYYNIFSNPVTNTLANYFFLLFIVASLGRLQAALDQPAAPFIQRPIKKQHIITSTGAPFELNLTEKKFTEVLNPQGSLLFGFVYRLPLIGHYATPYNLRNIQILINAPVQTIVNSLSMQTQQELIKQLDIQPTQLASQLEKLDTLYFFNAFGLLSLNSEQTTNLSHNLLYHTWVGSWYMHNQRMHYFNEKIHAGIFNPIGITSENRFPFHQFSTQMVHYHNGNSDAFSPNNMKFFVDNNSPYSFFTTIAISQDKKKITISQNLLMNNPQAEQAISYVAQSSKNLRQLIAGLDELAKKSHDSAVIRWTNILKDAFMLNQPAQLQKFSDSLFNLATRSKQ